MLPDGRVGIGPVGAFSDENREDQRAPKDLARQRAPVRPQLDKGLPNATRPERSARCRARGATMSARTSAMLRNTGRHR